MNKRFWILVGLIVALFGALIVFNNREAKKADTNNSGGNTTSQSTEHLRGKLDSKVSFVEYGDFQCPSCAQYEPLITALYEKYKDTVRFQFRNLPLTQIHQNAFAAARAAEAASNQGKFWEMHDKIYRGQQQWSQTTTASASFEAYARELGLNIDQYKTDVVSSETNSRINADKEAFQQLKLPLETPTFILNGNKIDLKNVQTLDDFSKFVDEALKAEGITPPAATTTPATENTQP